MDWTERDDTPLYRVVLWPHRSMTRVVRKRILWLAAIGLAIPLVPVLGTPVFWGLLPFEVGALGMLWIGFRRSDRDGRLREELTLWPDEMRVERFEPDGRVLRWTAVPQWVSVTLHPNGARVRNYLTLRGGGREIELGAFLGADERATLRREIDAALVRSRSARI